MSNKPPLTNPAKCHLYRLEPLPEAYRAVSAEYASQRSDRTWLFPVFETEIGDNTLEHHALQAAIWARYTLIANTDWDGEIYLYIEDKLRERAYPILHENGLKDDHALFFDGSDFNVEPQTALGKKFAFIGDYRLKAQEWVFANDTDQFYFPSKNGERLEMDIDKLSISLYAARVYRDSVMPEVSPTWARNCAGWDESDIRGGFTEGSLLQKQRFWLSQVSKLVSPGVVNRLTTQYVSFNNGGLWGFPMRYYWNHYPSHCKWLLKAAELLQDDEAVGMLWDAIGRPLNDFSARFDIPYFNDNHEFEIPEVPWIHHASPPPNEEQEQRFRRCLGLPSPSPRIDPANVVVEKRAPTYDFWKDAGLPLYMEQPATDSREIICLIPVYANDNKERVPDEAVRDDVLKQAAWSRYSLLANSDAIDEGVAVKVYLDRELLGLCAERLKEFGLEYDTFRPADYGEHPFPNYAKGWFGWFDEQYFEHERVCVWNADCVVVKGAQTGKVPLFAEMKYQSAADKLVPLYSFGGLPAPTHDIMVKRESNNILNNRELGGHFIRILEGLVQDHGDVHDLDDMVDKLRAEGYGDLFEWDASTLGSVHGCISVFPSMYYREQKPEIWESMKRFQATFGHDELNTVIHMNRQRIVPVTMMEHGVRVFNVCDELNELVASADETGYIMHIHASLADRVPTNFHERVIS